jgi:hypothetical protein
MSENLRFVWDPRDEELHCHSGPWLYVICQDENKIFAQRLHATKTMTRSSCAVCAIA